MLGGVPTRVIVPPRIAPNDRGMNNREGAMPVLRAMLATAGSSTATAATLFMNADSTPPTAMIASTSKISRSPMTRRTRPPIMSATPVCSSAPLTKKIDSMVITAGDAKPVNASLGCT